MAKIENTTDHPFDVSGFPRGDKPGVLSSIPRSTVAPDGSRMNGVGEIPDDVLAELLDKDPWTKGVFASGDLIDVSKSSSRPSAPVATSESSDPPSMKAKK